MLKPMLKPNRFQNRLILGSALFALSLSPVYADRAEAVEPGMMGGETEPEAAVIPSDDRARSLLLETAQRDDASDFAAAERNLDEAQSALDSAIAEGASDEKLTRLERERDLAASDLARESDESEALVEAILALDDQQVRDLNRALNNTRHNGQIPDLDAATLEEIAARDLGHREIQALTKALEEEARAEQRAERFERKFEETGREHFLAKRDRALEQGERQKGKFESKVDRFTDAREQAREGAKGQAREHAKGLARGQARDAAKQSAKANAKGNAKNTARIEARRAARDAARNNGRGRN